MAKRRKHVPGEWIHLQDYDDLAFHGHIGMEDVDFSNIEILEHIVHANDLWTATNQIRESCRGDDAKYSEMLGKFIKENVEFYHETRKFARWGLDPEGEFKRCFYETNAPGNGAFKVTIFYMKRKEAQKEQTGKK